METKQTAVEWLIEYMIENFYLTDGSYEAFKNAKKMEKEQIMDAYVECWKVNIPDGIECKLDAKQYYEETYKQ